jgi:hypothetical protein
LTSCNFKVNYLQPGEFLNWVAVVEEVLDFKEVPDDRRVPLVATKFWGRDVAWWQQQKQAIAQQGKEKINSWEQLLRHMWAAFLPHNYVRTMHQ